MLDKTFEKLDFTQQPLPKDDYEGCIFLHCDFSNADLSDIKFIDCEFNGCNLSMARLPQTVFNGVKFSGCKMLGLHFEHCSPFAFSPQFENCTLDHSSFYQVKLKKTVFKNCQLRELDLTEADCSSASFDGCDLLKSHFEQTILEKADLRTAFNYAIDPTLNKIKKARFSLEGLPGLLDRFDIVVQN